MSVIAYFTGCSGLVHSSRDGASKNTVGSYAVEVTDLFYCDFKAERMEGSMCFV